MSSDQCGGMDRRKFMQVSAAAAAATTAGAMSRPALAQDDEITQWPVKTPGADGLIHRNEREGMEYRKLGRTNFMCSTLVFGCGAALAGGRAVRLLDVAFEAGINLYDVGSNVYYKGSEAHLGPFLKAHRDEVFVVSKAPVRPLFDHKPGEPLNTEQAKAVADYWLQLLDESLSDLKVDYVDAYYLMAVPDAAYVKSEEIYNAFLKAKEAGKVSYFGISTHKRAEQVLDAAVETGWYDLAMIAITPAGWYDWDTRSLLEGTASLQELQPALARAREAGIGLVGMKAGRFLAGQLAGGQGDDTAFDNYYTEAQLNSGLDAFQRSYAYVLQNGLDVVNADMQNFTHLESNLAAVRQAKQYFA